ncbi:ABC transporter ATP-binding protein [Kordiimonas lacus]|uniref:Iron complex transport system ATP-binding protein n=1 Tax=Kordiimonas lacus TaxID=637679 RepID=A0A1G6YGN8_9PROT|nr:ABC transporter ATP-binding protein [Kordiimonas lacus]SDD89538.1 iron complex transport system ATP-binding protein [Kordiimonas lacus]
MNGLEIQNLAVTLGGNAILRDVSFTVEPGQVVGLIGANGAGKSTALKAVLGIVEPEAGDIRIGDQDVAALAPRERAKKLSYVPQGAPVHWPLTVERLVGLGRTPHLTPWQEVREEDQAVIRSVMEETDCWHLRNRLATTLSGGERSRVLLARTMAVGAPFMLADEPTASLDPLHQLQVMDIMRGQAACGAGVLLVLHDLSFALRYCDRLVLLHEGGVLASGTPADVLTDAHLETAFKVKVARWSEGGEQFLAPHVAGG